MKYARKQSVSENISPKRILVIYGPRRVGKTTLLDAYLKKQNGARTLYGVGDDFKLRELFQSENRDRILDFAGPYEIIALDEAQQLPSIGLGAKMIIDAFPEKKLILTGSSSFDLSTKIGEPLTGRHFTLILLPFAQSEMQASRFELENSLENFLIYGAYPEVLNASTHEQKVKILNELASSYLFKDVLALEKIKSPDLLMDIATCLAIQVGNEVSLNEIANTVKTDVKTVGRYLDLMEKMFVIKRIRGFSRNLRTEISKKAKYYFLDNGVRNAVIAQFNPLSLRNDIGALWENFIFMELYKQSTINEKLDKYYFWRTHGGQEIDIVREHEGSLEAIECKWSDSRFALPKAWREAYGTTSFITITKENYLDVLIPKNKPLQIRPTTPYLIH